MFFSIIISYSEKRYLFMSYSYAQSRFRQGSLTWVPPKLQRICSNTRLHPLLKTMSLDEFSMTTSLHGWHFIVNSPNWKHKLAWGILIGCSTGNLKSGLIFDISIFYFSNCGDRCHLERSRLLRQHRGDHHRLSECKPG